MNSQATDELQAFHCFISNKLSNGGGDLSPEEALDEWRELHPNANSFEDDSAAIQEAIDDMANGDRGRDADEVIAELRAKYGLPKP